ncbi:MAG TPA: methyltransferase domain-containing protein [Candidatus Nitrosotenuis sp.]|nr:methyltransferase domain-containing protein [Candidatus Nitrosotenuis sp.]
MNTVSGIQNEDYIRQRLAPKPGDADYIHLSDLLIALEKFRTDEVITILDYGCSGSPYRNLFPNADYRRADFENIENLDYKIGEDSKIDEKDETFDLILSTQVAEHVSNPNAYFTECFRLLKKGGKLICTTHGTYPDHGCPYDFQRWTADGLLRDLKDAGFSIVSVEKLTTNGRAVMYLIQRFSGWFETSSSSIWHLAFRLFRSFMHRIPQHWQKLSDKLFPNNRVVSSKIPGHEFYIGLIISAVKIKQPGS